MNSLEKSQIRNKAPLILIVDDVVENVEILYAILKDHGFRFALAQNSEETYRAIEREVPDLILLDVMMPDEDGFQTAAKIRDQYPHSNISIIFITARARTEDKLRGFQAGGVDYITKPFEEEEVLARVKTHIELQQMRRKQEDLIAQLRGALDEVKQLRGIIPICARCKKIRDDRGFWRQVEQYISEHSEAEFSHDLCPHCMEEMYSDLINGSEK